MKTAARSKLASEVLQAYFLIGDAMRMSALPKWITSDVTLSQLKAIILLDHHGEQTVTVLAQRLSIGKPAASTLVQQLVRQGLAQRAEDAADRRRTLVGLTARGAGLLASRREHIQMMLGGWVQQLPPEDLAKLREGLAALARVVEAEQESELSRAAKP